MSIICRRLLAIAVLLLICSTRAAAQSPGHATTSSVTADPQPAHCLYNVATPPPIPERTGWHRPGGSEVAPGRFAISRG